MSSSSPPLTISSPLLTRFSCLHRRRIRCVLNLLFSSLLSSPVDGTPKTSPAQSFFPLILFSLSVCSFLLFGILGFSICFFLFSFSLLLSAASPQPLLLLLLLFSFLYVSMVSPSTPTQSRRRRQQNFFHFSCSASPPLLLRFFLF